MAQMPVRACFKIYCASRGGPSDSVRGLPVFSLQCSAVKPCCGRKKKPHDAVVSKFIAALRGSPCDSTTFLFPRNVKSQDSRSPKFQTPNPVHYYLFTYLFAVRCVVYVSYRIINGDKFGFCWLFILSYYRCCCTLRLWNKSINYISLNDFVVKVTDWFVY